MEKLGRRLDHVWVGLCAGLIGPWIGGLMFYSILFNHKALLTFVDMVWHNNEVFSGLISVSLVFNLIFFFLALRFDWYRAARGVMMAVFLYAPLIVYFKYVS